MANKATFSQSAYALLLTMAAPAKEATKLATQLAAKKEGAYEIMVKAGIECAVLEVFQATLDKLTEGIARNTGGLAVKFGAEKRDKATEDGRRYKIPNAISSAGSQIVYALGHGVSLFTIDPKTKKATDKPESFTAIRKMNDAIRSDARVAEAEALTGHDGMVYRTRKVLLAVADSLGDLSDITLKAIQDAMHTALTAAAQAKAEQTDAGANVLETLKAAEGTPPAQTKADVRPVKKSRKQVNVNTVGEKLAA